MHALSLSLSMLVWTLSLGATPRFKGVSDSDLIARLADADPYDFDVREELSERLGARAGADRVLLIHRLIDTVEHSADWSLRAGCGAALSGAAQESPVSKDIISAHMLRIITQGDEKQGGNIENYITTLVKFDQSEETRLAILSVLSRRELIRRNHDIKPRVLFAMGHLGPRGEQFLIGYIERDPFVVPVALGEGGGHRAFKYLRSQARTPSGKIRSRCTFALGTWALTKPVGSNQRARAVRTIRALACDSDPSVKDAALTALTRIGAAPLTFCTKDDGENDDDTAEERSDE